MFNPFPELLTYSLLAPFILRTTVGFMFIALGMSAITGDRQTIEQIFHNWKVRRGREMAFLLGAVEIIIGAALTLGLYTQIAAIFVTLMSLFFLIFSRFRVLPGRLSARIYFLMLAISISLMFSGAGFFALDLPL